MSDSEQELAVLDIDELLVTHELEVRPARAPDHAAENRALGALAQELARQPDRVPQRLAELLRELCRAGSAGIAVPAPDGEALHWSAASGPLSGAAGLRLPRAGSRSGDAVARGEVVLLREPCRSFPGFPLEPPVVEMLLAPWDVGGEPLGTVWVASHDPACRFDGEDARLLRSLSSFAACAHRATRASGRAEDALRCADRRKDEFLATLAHELRNPLAPISNAVHLLRRPDGRRSADRMVEMVGRQVRQIVRLVDDLMDVSRITQGKLELRREPLSLGEVLSMAVETSMPAIEAGRHDLAVSLPEETLMLEADKVRLTQVFGNLLHNAARYTDRGGRIWVGAWREGAQVVVSVRDTGIGIPPEKLPHVFEMFAQAHRDSARGQAGLGIGLTMVKSLIALHGGSVEARSEGPGRGSEFIVRLPLVLAPPQEAQHDDDGADALLAGRRVLVVDDNGDAAESLALLLHAVGAEVRTAHDGAAGLALAGEFLPQAVLLDLGMPGMDGFEVARRLRGDARQAGLVIVALTGWGQDEDRRRTRAAGFDHHLTKPVDVDALLGILARVGAG